MSERTIPERVAADLGQDNLVHVICCNPNLADCGKDLSGRPFLPDDTETTCRICAISEAEDLPCADPDCPYRDDEGAVS